MFVSDGSYIGAFIYKPTGLCENPVIDTKVLFILISQIHNNNVGIDCIKCNVNVI